MLFNERRVAFISALGSGNTLDVLELNIQCFRQPQSLIIGSRFGESCLVSKHKLNQLLIERDGSKETVRKRRFERNG